MSSQNDTLSKFKDDLATLCDGLTGTENSTCVSMVTRLTALDANYMADSINKVADANKNTTVNLADKKTTVKIMNEKTNNIQQHIDNIKQERLNKKRVVEASEWEYDRYTSHIYILKFIFFTLVIINIILFIRNRLGFIPDAIVFGLIIVIVAVMLFNVGKEIMLNLTRDKFDYDKFVQTYGNEYNTNDGSVGVNLKGKSGNIFKSLMCEPFVSHENKSKKDTLNRHTYSFI
jgi:hypothetical protein